MKTLTKWKHDHVFESRQEENVNTITIDGDRLEGPGPKSLLLSGLAGCSAIDIVDILGKMKVSFSDFSIQVEADQTEEHPRVFKDILITFSMKTEAVHEEKIRKAIELSLEKYCGVSAMLKKNSAIHYKLQLIK